MRRMDTGWRDSLLSARHEQWGLTTPTVGTTLPMIEYDRGQPVGLISYLGRNEGLPAGDEVTRTYHALGQLSDKAGNQLPFLTAQYDPRNWSFRMFGHNDAARRFLNTRAWVTLTEQQFVNHLYRLRNRYTPDLSAYGVYFASNGWSDGAVPGEWPRETWPGSAMSVRRRNYEPEAQVRMSWRNPCVDIDLAVVDVDDSVSLVVDYKAPGARLGLDSTNLKALSSLKARRASTLAEVAAMVVGYEPHSEGWKFHVHCANRSARNLLSYALGREDNMDALAETVAGAGWVDLNEDEWKSVLAVARDV